MSYNGGIFSLAGFAFQMKVFVLQIKDLEDGDELEYETIDDVALSLSAESIDKNEDKLCTVVKNKAQIAIQVKKTDVAEKDAQRILLNWVMIDSKSGVIKYKLITDRVVSSNIFKDLDLDNICNAVSISKGTRSLEAKVRLLGLDNATLKKKMEDIVANAEVESIIDIDTQIINSFAGRFYKAILKEPTYYARVSQLLTRVTVEILEKISKGEPYILSYNAKCSIENSIISEITDDRWEPSYSNFKKLKKFDLSSLASTRFREYKQLKECKSLLDSDVLMQLQFGEFYADARRGYYERGMVELVCDIEDNAHDNFTYTKAELRNSNTDTPDNRLFKTQEKKNDKTQSTHIQKGVCIHLTGEDIEKEKQISWKDE